MLFEYLDTNLYAAALECKIELGYGKYAVELGGYSTRQEGDNFGAPSCCDTVTARLPYQLSENHEGARPDTVAL